MHMVNVDRNKAIRIYVTFYMFDILDYIFSLIFNFLHFFLESGWVSIMQYTKSAT